MLSNTHQIGDANLEIKGGFGINDAFLRRCDDTNIDEAVMMNWGSGVRYGTWGSQILDIVGRIRELLEGKNRTSKYWTT